MIANEKIKLHKRRIEEIDLAKGLAIILVVIGHVVARTPPLNNEWYSELKRLIYYFHMPFFVFLSGLVIGLTWRPISDSSSYSRYILGKTYRLAPAFILIGLAILVGKTVIGTVLFVDNKPGDLLSGLVDIIVRPSASSASSLWYIYVLYIYYLLLPIVFFVLRYYAAFIVVSVCVLLNYINPILTDYFMLNRVAEYLVFLVIGILISRNHLVYLEINKRYGGIFLFLFICSLTLNDYLLQPKLILGALSIPSLMYIVQLPMFRYSSFLLECGRYVFIIYLLNTIVIGLVKGVGFIFLPWDGPYFILYFPALLTTGLLFPIVIKKYLLSRHPYLDKITW